VRVKLKTEQREKNLLLRKTGKNLDKLGHLLQGGLQLQNIRKLKVENIWEIIASLILFLFVTCMDIIVARAKSYKNIIKICKNENL
jgi:hypothetical protein